MQERDALPSHTDGRSQLVPSGCVALGYLDGRLCVHVQDSGRREVRTVAPCKGAD
jgi:hypothetical protein